MWTGLRMDSDSQPRRCLRDEVLAGEGGVSSRRLGHGK